MSWTFRQGMACGGCRDPRPLYRASTPWVQALVVQVRPAQLEDPTPCEGFNVRALLGHLVATAHRGRATGLRQHTDAVPHVITDLADDAYAAEYAAAADAAYRAWLVAGRLEELAHAPWGDVSGRSAVWGSVNETIAHGRDLAVATGQPNGWRTGTGIDS